MTPFEIDLLKTAWPYIWTGILSAGAWFLRSQSARLDKICVAMNAFNSDVSRIEADLQAQRADTMHRLDTLIGAVNSRVGKIETVCEMQHGINLRRSGDRAAAAWAQTSDFKGPGVA